MMDCFAIMIYFYSKIFIFVGKKALFGMMTSETWRCKGQ